MRYIKLGLIAAVVLLGAIGILRIADVIKPDVAAWLAARSVGVVVFSVIVGILIGLISGPRRHDDSVGKPVP